MWPTVFMALCILGLDLLIYLFFHRIYGDKRSVVARQVAAFRGQVLKMLQGLEGRLEGDPRKIAGVILQLANSDEVPVRLILGVDAEKRVHQAEAARASEAEKWRHLTVSTVFEDVRFDSRLYMAKRGINC